MALAPIREVILGSVAFAVFWVLAVFPGVSFLPIGRTAGSILGAVLMVIFKVITPEQAYNAIDLSVLGLLFGTMVVSIYLERADMFKYLGILFSWKNQGAKDLLCRICIVAAISSALFTNDTTCVVLTEFILEIASKNNVPPHPFLLALASSANIGSSATPIGNPQNLIIAIQSGISFGEFVLGLLPAMLVGIAVNAAILICMYWTLLSTVKDEEIVSDEVVYEEGAASHRVLPVAMSPPAMNSQNCSSKSKSSPRDSRILVEGTSETDMCGVSSRESESKELNVSKEKKGEDAITHIVAEMEEKIAKGGVQGSLEPTTDIESGPQQSDREKNCLFIHVRKKIIWKACIYLVTIGMLIAFLMGLNMSWTALAAALIFVVIDFKDAGPSLEKVSYSLLVFFCGMFISVDGFNRTGIPSTLWTLMEPHARINQVSGITVLAIVILILSNVASNVPTVLLLGASVAASAAAISPSEGKKAWLILAWVSTVAGNFSLLGSAANLIVCEQARRAKSSHTLSFWSHLKFGIPSTLVVTAVGLTLIEVNLTLISTWLFSMKFTVLQSL